MVIWITGRSGAGKTTLAKYVKNNIENFLKTHVIILDGDEVRQGINRDLGFSTNARTENIRRIAEMAKLLQNKNFVIIVAVISPKRFQREMAKNIIGKDNFLELYCNTSLEECKKRDVKGLYAKEEIPNIPGSFDPNEYEQNPPWEVFYIPTENCSIDSCAEILYDEIHRRFSI